MNGGVQVSAAVEAIDQTAARIDLAAQRFRDLHGHPGRLHARALDTGDGDLADAVARLARAWDQSLGELCGEASRWADLLRAVAETYRTIEHVAVPSWTNR